MSQATSWGFLFKLSFMKKPSSKALEFIYQDTQIHFLLSQNDNVMVNATEMAKVFGKQIDNFVRLEGTQKFIAALLKSENSKFVPSDVREQLSEKTIIYGTNKATYMNRKLAIYFAFWLDVDFQIWIIDVMDSLLFGHYKERFAATRSGKVRNRDFSAKIKFLAERKCDATT